ncbi:MAG: tetratricopeptide repeat protein, partial [Candidatus Limisoma sp.]|nr:tetratricopeptide repeat protein [Bacteroidales bacterium]MDY5893797.1 tetratricopeptide repeat protein [Candidatus Limisoma sp.]
MKKYGLILLSLTAVGVSAQVPVTQTDAEGYLARGKQLYEIRNYTGCIDQLRTMSQFDAPADLVEEAEYYSAMAQYRRGDGIDALRRFVAAHPASVRRADVRFAIGNEYFMRSAFANALGEYNQVPETAFAGNESADLTYRRSFCYLRMAEFDKAKEGFDRLRSDRRYSECADFYTAYIQYCKSDYTAAENGFRKVRSGSKLYNEARFYIGQLRFHDADYASAVQIGNSLIDSEMPDDMKAELYRYVGESEYHLANNDRAISLLKRYTELCQGTPQRTSLYILGVAEFREGNDAEAIARLTDVVGEPDALAQSAYLYIGQAYLHQDNVDAAAMAFEKAYK